MRVSVPNPTGPGRKPLEDALGAAPKSKKEPLWWRVGSANIWWANAANDKTLRQLWRYETQASDGYLHG